MVVIGLGCRRGVAIEALLAAVSAVRERLPESTIVGGIATASIKRDDPAFATLAERTGLALSFVDAAALERASPRISTTSEAALNHLGVPSVAEAAALAAAGPDATLIVPRLIVAGVTGSAAQTGARGITA